MARPTNFKKEYEELAYNYCLLGATDDDLSLFFGVSKQTINTWKQKHPKFLDSLKKGKLEADSNVAKSLYNRATGYNHTDTQFASFQGVISDQKEYIKHVPPDITACIFWLKNRQPEKWREKQQVDHTTQGEKLNIQIVKNYTQNDKLDESDQPNL